MSSNQSPSYLLRMPNALRTRLVARAAAKKRSLHAEILDILQSSLDANPASDFDLNTLAEAVAARVVVKLKEGKG